MRLRALVTPNPTGFLTCHVLDTARGCPAGPGMRISLRRLDEASGAWQVTYLPTYLPTYVLTCLPTYLSHYAASTRQAARGKCVSRSRPLSLWAVPPLLLALPC